MQVYCQNFPKYNWYINTSIQQPPSQMDLRTLLRPTSTLSYLNHRPCQFYQQDKKIFRSVCLQTTGIRLQYLFLNAFQIFFVFLACSLCPSVVCQVFLECFVSNKGLQFILILLLLITIILYKTDRMTVEVDERNGPQQ